MVVIKRTTLAAVTLILGASPLLAIPRHALLLREAAAAAKVNDLTTVLAKLEEAARLRPDYPRVQMSLARTYATLGKTDAAIAALERIARMGLKMNVAVDPDLAPLRELPRFQAIAASLANDSAPVTATDEAAFAITDVTGIIESCLVDPETLHWYFADVRNRCIWHRDISSGVGLLKKFTDDADALDGVFKIALSADRKTLWATTATVGVMTGPDAETGKRTALVAIDYATGRVRERFPVRTDDRKHLLGDFVIAADGSIYATDSMSPVIWRLPAGGTALEAWLESDDFLSLQGLAFSGDNALLYVADYANGIWRIDIASKSVSRLMAPANATFFGIDGLYSVPDGLLAVQNGVNPQRVLRIELDSGRSSPTAIPAPQAARHDRPRTGAGFQRPFSFRRQQRRRALRPTAGHSAGSPDRYDLFDIRRKREGHKVGPLPTVVLRTRADNPAMSQAGTFYWPAEQVIQPTGVILRLEFYRNVTC
jgi:sugar lactone lactonase YvrE